MTENNSKNEGQNNMKHFRLFGFRRTNNHEVVRDFNTVEAALVWARANDVEINGILGGQELTAYLSNRKQSQKTIEAEWARFAEASFNYMRGIRS